MLKLSKKKQINNQSENINKKIKNKKYTPDP